MRLKDYSDMDKVLFVPEIKHRWELFAISIRPLHPCQLVRSPSPQLNAFIHASKYAASSIGFIESHDLHRDIRNRSSKERSGPTIDAIVKMHFGHLVARQVKSHVEKFSDTSKNFFFDTLELELSEIMLRETLNEYKMRFKKEEFYNIMEQHVPEMPKLSFNLSENILNHILDGIEYNRCRG